MLETINFNSVTLLVKVLEPGLGVHPKQIWSLGKSGTNFCGKLDTMASGRNVDTTQSLRITATNKTMNGGGVEFPATIR